MTEVLTIDCDECSLQGSDVCDDCIVTFLCDSEASSSTAVVIDMAEARAVRLLGDAGLVPRLRHTGASRQ